MAGREDGPLTGSRHGDDAPADDTLARTAEALHRYAECAIAFAEAAREFADEARAYLTDLRTRPDR